MRKIFLVTDYACNSACISCAKKPEEKGRLSFDEILQKLDAVNPTPDDFIEISGGEPTLRNDLGDLCRSIVDKYASHVIVLSNGRRFKDPAYARELQASGMERVMTTFYSPDEALHDAITLRPGSYAETLQGLKNLESIGVPISVKTIILEQNYRQLPGFARFAFDTFPTAWVSVHGLISRGQAKINELEVMPRYSDVAPYVEEALDIAVARDKNLGVFILPSCTIDPSYWQFLSRDWKMMTRSMVYISPEETVIGNLDTAQPAYCDGCLVSAHCSWAWESAWKEYTQRFGTDELRKITPEMVRR